MYTRGSIENEKRNSFPPLLLLLLFVFTAPSGYPQNVTVRQFNESSVLVQWLPPPVDQRNGLITAYQV
jgi:hypothetical protein